MNIKISNLSELTNIIRKKEKTDTGILFFKKVQNWAIVKAVFRSKETG
jgi:hypothetical protein